MMAEPKADPERQEGLKADGRSDYDRWRAAAIQAKNDLRAIEEAFRVATPIGEDGPNPPIGPGTVFAEWTSPANTMRWIEAMEAAEDTAHPDEWEDDFCEILSDFALWDSRASALDPESGFRGSTEAEGERKRVMDALLEMARNRRASPAGGGEALRIEGRVTGMTLTREVHFRMDGNEPTDSPLIEELIRGGPATLVLRRAPVNGGKTT